MQIINATVIVQAFNFGITYLFLKKILFKPIVQRIEQKEAAKKMLLDALKAKDVALLNLQNEKDENLEQFRASAKKFYAVDVDAEQEVPLAIAYKKNSEHQEDMVKKTKELLVKKVPYAY